MSELTQSRLKEVLTYDPETGHFAWLLPLSKKIKVGSRAGCVTRGVYRQIRIDGVKHYEHRLAWLYMTGKWPTNYIDHIDGDGLRNAFANLREATQAENLQNQVRGRGVKGLQGVSRYGLDKKFTARIGLNGKSLYVGRYATPEAAHEAYLDAKRSTHRFNPELRA